MSVHHSNCPSCGSGQVSEVLRTTDHTVSGEEFAIWHCARCSLRFTQDVPDEQHIGPYYASEDYISHSNTSRGLVAQLYQRVRQITLGQKRDLVRQATGKANGLILDYGSGTGEFLATMREAGWRVRGLEPDEGARAYARDNHGITIGEPAELFFSQSRVQEERYDAITLWHVLEHVHRLHDTLERLRTLLAPAGRLIIAVPNYTSPDGQHYGSDWAGYDVPRHLYHFSPAAMRHLMQKHDLRIEEERPMPFDGFYVSLLSERYRHGRLRPVAAFRRGLSSWWPGRKQPHASSSVIYFTRPA